jgi:multidrug efflux system outer membrane protein
MPRISLRVIAGGLLVLASFGCVVGPNYRRPAIAAPQTFRNAPAALTSTTASFADQKWFDVFQDAELQKLIRAALQQNYNVRIAAARILEAEARLGIVRANQYPEAAALLGGVDNRNARSKFIRAFDTSNTEVGLGFQWNVDFWGKYRRATESARDQLLAEDWARQAVVDSLVANVASAYFTLRDLDLQLQISQRTLASDRESLQLTQLLSDRGATSLLDVRQAEQLVYTAAGAISIIEKQIEQEQDLISILLGENPADVPRGTELTAQPHLPEVPPGLPSSLLERRPDIRQAEANLMSMNALIGVAKAAYFPSLFLTGTAGFQSIQLGELFSGPAGMWNFAGQLTQPLFTAGSLKKQVQFAQAQQQEAVANYQQTIQESFREVSDALIAYAKDQEFRKQQELLTQAAQDASRLSDLRYKGGAASYLEVLDSNTRLYSAELTLAQGQLRELLDYVQLYYALGGGWRQ